MGLIRQDWRIAHMEGLAGAMQALAQGQIKDEYQLAEGLRAHANAIDPQFSRVFWVHILALQHAIHEVSRLSGEDPAVVWRRVLRHGDASQRTMPPEQLESYVKWEI